MSLQGLVTFIFFSAPIIQGFNSPLPPARCLLFKENGTAPRSVLHVKENKAYEVFGHLKLPNIHSWNQHF